VRAETEDRQAPRWARWFVRLFLVAFVVCGVFGIEAWPLTGWRLFSHLRTDHRTTWQATVVGIHGEESALEFGRLPLRFHGFVLLMRDYPDITESQRTEMCVAWTGEARAALAEDVAEIRVYRVDEDLLPRAGSRPAEPAIRTLLFTCEEGDGVGAG
jgi:hypothetical protein